MTGSSVGEGTRTFGSSGGYRHTLPSIASPNAVVSYTTDAAGYNADAVPDAVVTTVGAHLGGTNLQTAAATGWLYSTVRDL